MFQEGLVLTDRNDLTEVPVRHRDSRVRRFIDRFGSVVVRRRFPTSPTTFEPDDTADDLEVQTDNAIRPAIRLAQRNGARLPVRFLLDAFRYDTRMDFATDPLVEAGETAVDGLVKEAERAGLDTVGSVDIGQPAELLMEYIQAQEINIVVPKNRTGGSVRSRLRRGLVGTLTRQASIPP
jgi:nucleotide-binding universal stress UspA family protein